MQQLVGDVVGRRDPQGGVLAERARAGVGVLAPAVVRRRHQADDPARHGIAQQLFQQPDGAQVTPPSDELNDGGRVAWVLVRRPSLGACFLARHAVLLSLVHGRAWHCFP